MKNKTNLTVRISIALLMLTAILYSCKTNHLSQKVSNNNSGNFDTVFFDENWKECKRKNATYYRLVEKDDANFIVMDMYLDHNPQMIAVCSSIDPIIKNGKCTYYEKGRIKSSEGSYADDKKTGIWIEWRDNGNDSLIFEYKPDGVLCSVRVGQKSMNESENDLYEVVPDLPQFPGGDQARMNFLVANMRYPETARRRGIQGTVYVSFIVEIDGSVSNAKILQGIGGGCDEEVIRIVSIMPKWKPGMLDGNPVRVQFNMPVKFTLTSFKKKNNK